MSPTTYVDTIYEWVIDQARPVHRNEVCARFGNLLRVNHIDQILSRLVDVGKLVRPGRGTYLGALPRQDYPEHEKMYPFSQFDKIIEFVGFLQDIGYVDPDMTDDDLRVHLRSWRGVDELAYQAEVAHLRSQYRHLWQQYRIEPLPGLMTGLGGQKIRVVDLGPPEPEPEPEPATVVTGADDGLELLLTKLRGK